VFLFITPLIKNVVGKDGVKNSYGQRSMIKKKKKIDKDQIS
jgi:hypothetical protein